MKKYLLILCCAVLSLAASAQDSKLTLNAGFLFPSTLNATVGYERLLSYGNAVELFGEMGNHWQKDDFWYNSKIISDYRKIKYLLVCRFPLTPVIR